jgi:predicted transcriptional regulator
LEDLANQTGAAIAFAAHFAKGNASGKNAIDRISGSGVFARDPDSILVFTEHESENAFTIEPILRNFPYHPPFVTRWNFPLMIVDNNLDATKLKQPGKKKEYNILELLQCIENNDELNPISVSEWCKRAVIKRTTLISYLSEMRIKNFVKTVGEGIKSKQIITNEGKAFIANSNK